MNAYKLADKLFQLENNHMLMIKASNMLRQQADRIAELEKLVEEMKYEKSSGVYDVSSKPVAWWTGKFDDECEDFMFPDTRQSHIDHPQSETHNFFPIPLYTHPHKELSDEEIYSIMVTCIDSPEHGHEFRYKDFARAIIKASRGDE